MLNNTIVELMFVLFMPIIFSIFLNIVVTILYALFGEYKLNRHNITLLLITGCLFIFIYWRCAVTIGEQLESSSFSGRLVKKTKHINVDN